MKDHGKEDRTGHPDDVRLAAYAEGSLRGTEARELEKHLAACSECRAAVADVAPLLGARPPRRRGWIGVSAAATAAAAAVALIVIANPLEQGDAGVGERLRPGPGADRERVPAIRVVAPAEAASLTGDSVRFIWRGGASDALYRLTLTDEVGRILWEETVPDTVLDLPAEIELDDGAEYLWYLDATLPDGGVATTGVRRLRIR